MNKIQPVSASKALFPTRNQASLIQRAGQFFVFLLIAATLQACVPAKQSGTAYSRDEARRLQQVQLGTVVDVTPVVIEGTKSGAGGAVGGVVGGIAGSRVDSGAAGEIAAVLVGVAGAVVGAKVEEATTRANGSEYTIRLDNGEVISVVQANDNAEAPIAPGDKVKLLSQRGKYRVTRLPSQ